MIKDKDNLLNKILALRIKLISIFIIINWVCLNRLVLANLTQFNKFNITFSYDKNIWHIEEYKTEKVYTIKLLNSNKSIILIKIYKEKVRNDIVFNIIREIFPTNLNNISFKAICLLFKSFLYIFDCIEKLSEYLQFL